LDAALYRRFDDTIQYENPSATLAAVAIQNRLAPFATTSLNFDAAGTEAVGLSFAEIVKACEEAAKHMVLAQADEVLQSDLISAIRMRKGPVVG
jgi:ATP-dependent 26S proteasome regulatory subunit